MDAAVRYERDGEQEMATACVEVAMRVMAEARK